MTQQSETQKLKRIRERRSKIVGLPWRQFNGSDLSGNVHGENEAVCRVYAQPLKAAQGKGISTEGAAANLDFFANSADDIDFLLSLIDSQAADARTESYHNGFVDGSEAAAATMRDVCVEKVKSVPTPTHLSESGEEIVNHFRARIVRYLESLTLDTVKQEKELK